MFDPTCVWDWTKRPSKIYFRLHLSISNAKPEQLKTSQEWVASRGAGGGPKKGEGRGKVQPASRGDVLLLCWSSERGKWSWMKLLLLEGLILHSTSCSALHGSTVGTWLSEALAKVKRSFRMWLFCLSLIIICCPRQPATLQFAWALTIFVLWANSFRCSSEINCSTSSFCFYVCPVRNSLHYDTDLLRQNSWEAVWTKHSKWTAIPVSQESALWLIRHNNTSYASFCHLFCTVRPHMEWKSSVLGPEPTGNAVNKKNQLKSVGMNQDPRTTRDMVYSSFWFILQELHCCFILLVCVF